MTTKKKIRKGYRRPFPFFNISLPILFKPGRIYTETKYIKFTNSCIYEFDDGYRGVNKLFGFSIGFHHNNSFRFGWRPNKNLDKIEVVGYEYIGGFRSSYVKLTELELNELYVFSISYIPQLDIVRYCVKNEKTNEKYFATTPFKRKRKYSVGYKLGLYFGGIYKAPQEIIVFK